MDKISAVASLQSLVRKNSSAIPLYEGALIIASAFDPDVEISEQLTLLDNLSHAARQDINSEQNPLQMVNALNSYLFDHLGLIGNESNYYDPRNSFVNQVLKNRTGIPITLSLIYIEIGRKLGIPFEGVGMPGHFLVRHANEVSFYIDPFHRGAILSKDECANLMQKTNPSVRWSDNFLLPISNIEILARILRNLCAIWLQQRQTANAILSLTLLITLQPDELGHYRDRGMLFYQSNSPGKALDDLSLYLTKTVAAPDKWYVQRVINSIQLGENLPN